MLFNDPALNLRADYSLFERTKGRPVCVGNGETCRRQGKDGIEQWPCPGASHCAFGQGECKPYARLHVLIGDGEADALGGFVLRTTSFNTIRTLAARLAYFHAVSGGLLACLPLELKLRGKSTAMSYGTPIYYVDLTIRTGLTLDQAISEARATAERRGSVGFDQNALDDAAQRGFTNGAFEELDEDGSAVVEEFFPAATPEGSSPLPKAEGLRGRLEAKVKQAAIQEGACSS
jgi:hypothetical protein